MRQLAFTLTDSQLLLLQTVSFHYNRQPAFTILQTASFHYNRQPMFTSTVHVTFYIGYTVNMLDTTHW